MSELMDSESIRKVALRNATVSAYVKTARVTGNHAGAASDCIVALAGELERVRARSVRASERECPDMRVHFPEPCEHPSSDGNADGRYICCECGADEGPVALTRKPEARCLTCDGARRVPLIGAGPVGGNLLRSAPCPDCQKGEMS